MFVNNGRFERFASKLWHSSPTMHEDEHKYMTEAFETNWMSTVGTYILAFFPFRREFGR